MLEITDLLADFRGLTRAAFLSKYDCPVLLHQTNVGDPTGVRGFIAGRFRRRLFSTPTVISAHPAQERQTSRSASGVLVFCLRGKSEGGFTNVVTVGRGGKSDVELPYDQVSKLHAYFTADGDGWTVCDMHTTNGTYVNGERIPAEQPVPITPGTRLKLGSAELIFFTPPHLHDHISALAAAMAPRA